jgi:predicted  nucleic acid-binding Zn-ribbon protein
MVFLETPVSGEQYSGVTIISDQPVDAIFLREYDNESFDRPLSLSEFEPDSRVIVIEEKTYENVTKEYSRIGTPPSVDHAINVDKKEVDRIFKEVETKALSERMENIDRKRKSLIHEIDEANKDLQALESEFKWLKTQKTVAELTAEVEKQEREEEG